VAISENASKTERHTSWKLLGHCARLSKMGRLDGHLGLLRRCLRLPPTPPQSGIAVHNEETTSTYDLQVS
jgi:hypothetical protein